MQPRKPRFLKASKSFSATFLRISPFLLRGCMGVSSVISPATKPYIYTLSRKTNFAFADKQAKIVFSTIGNQSLSHTFIVYSKPTQKYTTSEPSTAFNKLFLSITSAETCSHAPKKGRRLTPRTFRPFLTSSLANNLPEMPLIPNTVCMVFYFFSEK